MAQITPRAAWIKLLALAALCACAADARAQAEPPPAAAAYFRLAQGWAASNQPLQALAAVDQALALAPQQVEYLRARAQYANWLGRRAEACDSLERAVALQPDSAATLLDLARAESWAGRLDASARHFRAYVAGHPDDRDARLDHVRTESWRGNYARALELLEAYRAAFGTTVEYRKLKARVLASAGRVDESRALLFPLLYEAPDDYELRFTETLDFHNGRQPRQAEASLSNLVLRNARSADTAEIRRLVTAGLRDQVAVGAEYYTESDSVRILRGHALGRLQLDPELRLTARVEGDELWADRGSGLENIDGTWQASCTRALAGLAWRVSPQVDLDLQAGVAEADNTYAAGIYRLLAGYQPADTFRLLLDSSYDFYAVSPRAVSLGIQRAANRLQADWEPDLTWHLMGSAAYDALSDGNNRWEGVFAPRAVLLRSAALNVDGGPHLWWYGFSEDRNHGYYDPFLYQRYAWNTYLYWKISADDGIGCVVSLGEQKDDRESRFTFSASCDVEARFGVYRDWMLVLRVANTLNAGGLSGGNNAHLYTAELTRRF